MYTHTHTHTQAIHAFKRAAKAVALRNLQLKHAAELEAVGDDKDASELKTKVSLPHTHTCRHT
jgi:hypothetical protein